MSGNLLVVDWDYFFEEKSQDPDLWPLYDWSHAESPLYIEIVWNGRASSFLRNDLPLPLTTGEEKTFWERFKFAEDAKLYFAESNMMAAWTGLTEERFDEVWLYDAHHDSGYGGEKGETIEKLVDEGLWSCENWMVLYHALGARLHVRYPHWKSWALKAEPWPLVPLDRQVDTGLNGPRLRFDAIFVCRSGAWTPPWIDADFFRFINSAPVSESEEIGDYEVKDRGFSLEAAQREADILNEYMKGLASASATE